MFCMDERGWGSHNRYYSGGDNSDKPTRPAVVYVETKEDPLSYQERRAAALAASREAQRHAAARHALIEAREAKRYAEQLAWEKAHPWQVRFIGFGQRMLMVLVMFAMCAFMYNAFREQAIRDGRGSRILHVDGSRPDSATTHAGRHPIRWHRPAEMGTESP